MADEVPFGKARYTPAEIGKMREAVKTIWNIEHYNEGSRFEQRTVAVEAILQTYLLNGTSPDDLAAHADRRRLERDLDDD